MKRSFRVHHGMIMDIGHVIEYQCYNASGRQLPFQLTVFGTYKKVEFCEDVYEVGIAHDKSFYTFEKSPVIELHGGGYLINKNVKRYEIGDGEINIYLKK